VAVVGGRNSAVEAALDLYRHGARVTLIHRGAALSEGVKYWILPDIQNRIKAREVKAMFNTTVREIGEDSMVVQDPGGNQTIPNHFMFVLVGFHPDGDQLQRFGVRVDPTTLAPMFSECTFETNIPRLYVAGSMIGGRDTNKVFVENGRMHGPAIIAAIRSRS
jgi:thioredoxin reductase (NADPH)